jgi:hypothetical protein
MAPQDPLLQPGDQKAEDDLPVLTYELAFKVRSMWLSLQHVAQSATLRAHTCACLCAQLYKPKPELDKLLMMQFDTGFLGGPTPLPQRLQAMKATKLPQVGLKAQVLWLGSRATQGCFCTQEHVGLYVERQPSLGLHSLIKMEQRVTKVCLRLAQAAIRSPGSCCQHM